MVFLYDGKRLADIPDTDGYISTDEERRPGCDIDEQDEAMRAYEAGEPFAHIDDDGIAYIDYSYMEI